MTEKLSKRNRDRFERLATTNISDALDVLDINGSTYGIRPIWEGAAKIVGQAVTVKMTAAGAIKSKNHLGVKAIHLAEEGDVVVVDNGGRLDTSCWGGVLTVGAKAKGLSGVVIDGACRDVDEYIDEEFSVYARGAVVSTARGRIMEEATNVLIQFGGVQVSPGDIVVADRSGVVIVPVARMEEVLKKSEELLQKEEAMINDIRLGMSILEVDNKYSYEKMLEK
jgi:regulator of RNase E activity RraA